MKPVYSKETLLRMPNGVVNPLLFTFTSPRVTQINPKDADEGGILQRGSSFRSVYAKTPSMMVYLSPVNVSVWMLSKMQLRASVITFDPYGTGEGSTQIADPVNIDASGLLATMGRLYFDLDKYATSEIRLEIRNRATSSINLKVRVEIYENDVSEIKSQTQKIVLR